MPLKRMSTKTSRQRAASKRNLAQARKHAHGAREANAHGGLAQSGMLLRKAAQSRAMAGGAKPRGKTIEPKAHKRPRPKAVASKFGFKTHYSGKSNVA
jgi:hypothetical protein